MRRVDQYKSNQDVSYKFCKERYLEVRQEYEDFRETNKLKRSPNLHEDNWVWVILVALIVLEGGVNAEFFGQNLEGGWMAGLWVAMAASFINVVPLCALGFFARFKNHIKKWWLGYICIIVALAWTMVVGWFAGHYRDGIFINGFDFPSNFNPIKFATVPSYVLFVLTILCGFYAMYKGYVLDDAYPGYSAIAKKYQEASKNWAILLKQRREKLVEILENSTSKIAENLQTCSNGVQSMRRSANEKQNYLTTYQTALRSLELSHHALISLYRGENQKARSDDAPAYFQEVVPYDMIELPAIQTTTQEIDNQRIASLEAEVTQLNNDSVSIREQIGKAFNSYEEQIKIEIEVK